MDVCTDIWTSSPPVPYEAAAQKEEITLNLMSITRGIVVTRRIRGARTRAIKTLSTFISRTFLPSMADEIDYYDDDDRRVVYVGKIRRNSTTKTKLRKRFERLVRLTTVNR